MQWGKIKDFGKTGVHIFYEKFISSYEFLNIPFTIGKCAMRAKNIIG